jgi:ferric-dicitrate binding protein FerR (iron transport regulator)
MTRPKREELNELADKWLKGSLTPKEKDLLDQWYDLDIAESVDWTVNDESEEQLGRRLLTGIQERKKSSFLFKRRWQIPVAAVLLITLSVSIDLYISKQNIHEQVALAKEIKPGKSQAMLTLANGQRINLTDEQNGQLANQWGIRITKAADGKLIYRTDDVVNNNSAPEYNTLQTPVGGQWQIYLPDGSLVFLNAASSITYPTRFIGKERKVRLSGEAYFEIIHNKEMPFKVESQDQLVEVLGTHFNIMAYADEKVIKTTLLEGSVKVSHRTDIKLLHPGEQAQVTQNDINVISDVDLEDVVAWKNGYFNFNESLESILTKIARWYDVKIEYKTQSDPELTFSGKISRSRNLSDILKRLEYNGDVHFRIEERRVIVTK